MKPIQSLKWINGLRAGYASLHAKQRDLFAWMAKSDECYVFSAEIDHIDKENNVYCHEAGTFRKYVPPLTREQGDQPVTIRHAQELYDAIMESHRMGLKCRLLLLKGTRVGSTKGGIKSAADEDYWMVTKPYGSVAEGFGFTLVCDE